MGDFIPFSMIQTKNADGNSSECDGMRNLVFDLLKDALSTSVRTWIPPDTLFELVAARSPLAGDCFDGAIDFWEDIGVMTTATCVTLQPPPC